MSAIGRTRRCCRRPVELLAFPGVGTRVARGASRAQATGGRDRRARSRSAGTPAPKGAARRRKVQSAGRRCTECQRRARSGLCAVRPRERHAAGSEELRGAIDRGGRSRRFTCWTRTAGIDRATCRGSSRRARADGLPLLIVQGVVQSELTAAADFVLPGSTSFEKDASYTNDQGRVQGAALVIAPPGDAQDDCALSRASGRCSV